MASMMLQRAPVLRPNAAVSAGRLVIAKRVNLRPVSRKTTVSPQAFFFGGGGNKSSGSQFYICVDCGYIYDGMAGPWNEIPSYFRCPACNSPKSRFKVYKGDDVKGKPNNSKATMQKRMKEKKW